MKKILLALAVLAATLALPVTSRATVTIDIIGGDLKTDSTGLTAAPKGSLVLLILSGADLQFGNTTQGTALQAGQYVTGDDTILGAFALNDAVDGSGAGDIFVGNYQVTAPASQTLSLRWFPSITLADYNLGKTPAAGANYGSFAGATTGTPNGGDPWVVPSDSLSASLNMATISMNTRINGGVSDALPNSSGYASLKVVPEPATLFLTGAGVLGLMAVRRRKR